MIFMHYGYARSEPGHPGISLHADGQPYGSKIFGFEGSCPVLIRVLYYLDDLIPEVSPFRVVPRSHLCLHADANPYTRYESHPEEVMVPCKAGSCRAHPPPRLPRQLPQRRCLPARNAGHRLPTRLGRAG